MEIKVISSTPFSSSKPDLAIEQLNNILCSLDNVQSFSDARLSYFRSSRTENLKDKVIAYMTVKLK